MKRYLLDRSAFLTLRDDEEGANQVAEIPRMARAQNACCFECFLTLMEIFYLVWKDGGKRNGRLVYEQCRTIPVE